MNRRVKTGLILNARLPKTMTMMKTIEEADPELETKWPVRNHQNTAIRNIDRQKRVTKVATNLPKKTNIEIIVMERGKEKQAVMESTTVNHLKNPDVKLMIRR